MMENLLYAVLAILGLGFLVFIHELGHYLVARRRGMRVEAFAIGFGKPLFTWEHQGVKWHLCMLPFGGYVKIAGMQKEGNLEPYEIPDGFYGKKPWPRIQVALAGPLVNIGFAFLCFVALWSMGGRKMPFSDFTHRIGWVDPKSELYAQGVRPGDVIQTYAGKSFNGFKDLLIAGIMNEKTTHVTGYKIDYRSGQKIPFDYTLQNYEMPRAGRDKISTIGILSPASFLIYDDRAQLPAGSPMAGSNLLPRDRIVWVDGEVAFSVQQITSLINESTAFITVQRGKEIFQTKVPRIQLKDLKMSASERGEIDDWQHEAKLPGRLQELYFIPYNLSPNCKVESQIRFIDEEDQTRAFQKCERCSYFSPLLEDDQILAIDGKPVTSSYELLSELQTRHALVMVERTPGQTAPIGSWNQADAQFDDFSSKDLNAIVASIGTNAPVKQSGNLVLLEPVAPRPFMEYPFTPQQREQIDKSATTFRKSLDSIQDPEKRSEAIRQWEKQQNRAILGINFTDRQVVYNPSPFNQFNGVFEDTWRGLFGLVSGYLNPKYLSGPVGIVHIVHNSWMLGAKEALYWLAVISLNLGLLNLLPIPVLDGGHIMFSVWEAITRRPIRSKTMERLVIPFVGLLIAFFIFVTYQDLARLFSHLF